jgi:hypothetical protein
LTSQKQCHRADWRGRTSALRAFPSTNTAFEVHCKEPDELLVEISSKCNICGMLRDFRAAVSRTSLLHDLQVAQSV